MDVARRVALNTAFLYGRMAITVFVSLYATRLVLGALGASDYGIFNVVGGAIALLTFLNNAMAAASQRFMSYAQGEGDKDKQRSIFNVSIILHILIAFLIVLVLEIAGYFLFNGILQIPFERVQAAKIVFQLMLVNTFFVVLSVPYDAAINSHEDMLFVAIIGVIEALLKLAIAIYITHIDFDKLKVYSALMILLPVFVLIARAVFCHRKYFEIILNPKKYWNKELFNEMTSFAGWSFFTNASSALSLHGIAIILNSFFGVLLNAAQGIAAQVSAQLMSFSSTMLKALNPVVVKSEGKDNRMQMLDTTITGSKLSFFLLILLATPAMLEMPYILKIWLKDVPEYTVIFCRLRILAMYISQLTVVFPVAIGAIGKIRNMSLLNSLIWISLLPTSILMFRFGLSPEMIYVNFIIINILISLSCIYFLNRLGGLSLKRTFKDLIARGVAVVCSVTLIGMLPIMYLEESIMRLFIVILTTSVAYIFIFYFIGLDKKEKEVFYGGVRVLLSKLRYSKKISI